MSFIAVYITHADELAAKKVVNFLVEKKYIACANIFPIESAYWWKQEINQEGEYVSLVKTTHELWSTLVKAVESIHPYEVPCIMKFEVEANHAYENWIRESVISTDL